MQLSEQEVVRREKLARLRKMGIDPYPADLYPLDTNSKKIKDQFVEGKKVVIAGRLMSRRIQGKASFAELQDASGRIQYTSIEMKSVQVKIKRYIMMFTRNY